MEIHGAHVNGPFIIDGVILKPDWIYTDVGRVIYVIAEDKFYFGNSNSWVEMGTGNSSIEIFDALPTWSSEYTGKIIYVSGEDKFYTGKSSEWSEMGAGSSSQTILSGVGDPPDPTGLEDGTIYFKYSAPPIV